MSRKSILVLATSIFLFGAINAQIHLNKGTVSKERIIGGKVVDIKSYPYQVAILALDGFTCGGSIITPRHILTAAHCFMEDNHPEHFRVKIGTSFRYPQSFEEFLKFTKNVSQIITHEKFKYVPFPEFVANDIAIVVLEEPLSYSDNVQKIPLISRNVKKGEVAYVSGWGRTKNSYESKRLRALRMLVDGSCNHWDLSEPKVCAQTGRDSGACHGDSGGPLTVGGKLVGIVSGSPTDECAVPDQPTIFTSVFHHKAWIKRHIGN